MTPRRVSNVLVVIVFLAVVGGYGAVGLVKTVRERARWAMIRFVPWRLAPTWLEARFAERLPLRLAVAGWHGRAKAEWLHVSPTPRVLLGRQGWLYYNQSAEPGAVPPDDPAFPERLDRWAGALSARRAWLERRGIKYLIVLVPDKRSIYPEFVPRFAHHRGPPGVDELMVRCAGDPELTVLDLRPTLRALKSDGPVFWHTDTHWCPAGMRAGYAATATALARLFPVVGPPSPTGPERRVHIAGGDLARLIGSAERMPEEAPYWEWLTPPRARLVAETGEFQTDPMLAHVRPQVWVNDAPHLPRLLLLGDSFASEEFCAQLAEHCSRLVKVGSYASQEDLIERERPDVVIFEFTERMLETFVPRRPSSSLQHPDLLRVGK